MGLAGKNFLKVRPLKLLRAGEPEETRRPVSVHSHFDEWQELRSVLDFIDEHGRSKSWRKSGGSSLARLRTGGSLRCQGRFQGFGKHT
jgi:hypothetical protein